MAAAQEAGAPEPNEKPKKKRTEEPDREWSPLTGKETISVRWIVCASNVALRASPESSNHLLVGRSIHNGGSISGVITAIDFVPSERWVCITFRSSADNRIRYEIISHPCEMELSYGYAEPKS